MLDSPRAGKDRPRRCGRRLTPYDWLKIVTPIAVPLIWLLVEIVRRWPQ